MGVFRGANVLLATVNFEPCPAKAGVTTITPAGILYLPSPHLPSFALQPSHTLLSPLKYKIVTGSNFSLLDCIYNSNITAACNLTADMGQIRLH